LSNQVQDDTSAAQGHPRWRSETMSNPLLYCLLQECLLPFALFLQS